MSAHRASVPGEPQHRREGKYCGTCDEFEPVEDEGRYCGTCEDYEGTCENDHCLTCGEST